MIHNSKIFLDSGNPAHTRSVLEVLGQLEGQTTNPSLVAKSPEIRAQFEADGVLSEEGLLHGYQKLVSEMKELMPNGSISIEVYADHETTAAEMIEQAREFAQWIKEPHIKLPITISGLEAAKVLVAEGFNINMTLCFSVEQALAVHGATLGAGLGQVFVSPFVGRLDDIGICGISLIEEVSRVYKELGSHVSVLAASTRNVDHLYALLQNDTDILTIPYKLFAPWQERGIEVPEGFSYEHDPAKEMIRVEFIDDAQMMVDDWRAIDVQHDLTDAGLEKFAADWNVLLGR